VFDFQIGAQVAVSVKSGGNEAQLTGTVMESPQTAPADAPEQQQRSVLIGVPNLPGWVRSGDLAQVSLVLERSEDAVILPKDALHEYLGRNYVYILEEETRKERTVETGIETPTQVEIVKGLEAGQKVILR
jgi:hypothetical protein